LSVSEPGLRLLHKVAASTARYLEIERRRAPRLWPVGGYPDDIIIGANIFW